MNSIAATTGIIGAAVATRLTWATLAPTSSFWGTVHFRSMSNQPEGYALTFDDGPTRDSTTAILDILAELRVQATFFVIGANAQKNPDLLVRMQDGGHLIANHSLDHFRLGMFCSRRYWTRQIQVTNAIIERAIGCKPAMFRPPLGAKIWCAINAAKTEGLSVVTWNRRGVDGIATTPERIINRLVPHTVHGDVVLLHDGVEPGSRRKQTATVKALKPLIQGLRDRGLSPVPLDQLLGLPAYLPGATSEPIATERTP
jgi:peptidoglycan/xylan/chitin deacetylase (PgdA/CDA1 family)